MGRLKYRELANKHIAENKCVTISEAITRESDEEPSEVVGYSVTEQLVSVDSTGKESRAFLKNGLGVLSYDGLCNLGNAVTEAISKINNNK